MIKLPVYFWQDGIEALVLITPEELDRFNQKMKELIAQDKSWAMRQLEILNPILDEMRANDNLENS